MHALVCTWGKEQGFQHPSETPAKWKIPGVTETCGQCLNFRSFYAKRHMPLISSQNLPLTLNTIVPSSLPLSKAVDSCLVSGFRRCDKRKYVQCCCRGPSNRKAGSENQDGASSATIALYRAPCNSWLFPGDKRAMNSQRFESIQDIKATRKVQLQTRGRMPELLETEPVHLRGEGVA